MGEYIVNGERVSLRGDRATARDLKTAARGQANDWVLATLPGGKVVEVKDSDQLPVEAENYTITPAYEYG